VCPVCMHAFVIAISSDTAYITSVIHYNTIMHRAFVKTLQFSFDEKTLSNLNGFELFLF